MRELWLLLLLAFSVSATAEEPALLSDEHTAFLGRSLKQQFLPDVVQDCPDDAVCMDGYYVWTLEVKEHISGPKVSRIVRAAMLQHGKFHTGNERSLFVIARILDSDKRRLLGVEYYIEEYAPPRTLYCLDDKTIDYGLGHSEKIHSSLVPGCYSP